MIRLSAKGFGEAEVDRGNHAQRRRRDARQARRAQLPHEAGIGGLHFYHGIPGAVGGALRMNAGANGVETRDGWSRRGRSTARASVASFSNADMGYTYRHSSAPGRADLHLGACSKGTPADKAAIKAAMDAVQTTARPCSRSARRPAARPSRTRRGTSAWKEIDKAGCRGLMIGGAQMSPMHCNFMINTGTATGYDLEYLGETVRARVLEKSGIRLQWEIKRIGNFRPGHAVQEFLGQLL